MDILNLEMKQLSSKMDTLKEQLRQMEDEQHKSEQATQINVKTEHKDTLCIEKTTPKKKKKKTPRVIEKLNKKIVVANADCFINPTDDDVCYNASENQHLLVKGLKIRYRHAQHTYKKKENDFCVGEIDRIRASKSAHEKKRGAIVVCVYDDEKNRNDRLWVDDCLMWGVNSVEPLHKILDGQIGWGAIKHKKQIWKWVEDYDTNYKPPIKKARNKRESAKLERKKKMEEEQYKTEQERHRMWARRLQKQNIQTDSTIQDLETMIHADLSYNIPITYIDDTNGRVRTSAMQTSTTSTGSSHYIRSSSGVKNHNIKQTTLFDYKKDYFRNNIVNFNKFKKGEIGSHQIPRYPIQGFNGEHLSEGPGRSEPILRSIATNILAETSDKFVAILNIVKQQDARIKELEKQIST